MRGTIFYTGNRMQAVDSALYYLKHKEKVRRIMSRQSPRSNMFRIIPSANSTFNSQCETSRQMQSTLEKQGVEVFSLHVPFMSPTNEQRVSSGDGRSARFSRDCFSSMRMSVNSQIQVTTPPTQNVNNLHVARVHRVTPSKQVLYNTHDTMSAPRPNESRLRSREALPARVGSLNFVSKKSNAYYK